MVVKNEKAFTLIELLVVISIIALLVSILMPALSKARQNAKFLICKTRQRSIVQAVNLYQADYNGKLPPSTQGNNSGWWTIPMRLKYYYGSTGANGGSVTDILGKYMETGEYFDCPLAKHNPDWQNQYYTAMRDDNVDFLNCSYYLLWNWKRCINKNPNFPDRPNFNPTGRGKDKLMTCDFLIYNESYNNNYNKGKFWISPHPWKGASSMTFADAMANATLNQGFKFWMEDDQTGQNRPDMKMAAGYLDGRVDTVDSLKYELMSDGFHYLPDVRR
ncbi:MAG: type II secretion system protein [Phycisphaerae bacterium]|nr:type II secretion system protein [Phycisphaerae bacterium]